VEGTAAAVAIGIARGADIVRVHDVEVMARVAKNDRCDCEAKSVSHAYNSSEKTYPQISQIYADFMVYLRQSAKSVDNGLKKYFKNLGSE